MAWDYALFCMHVLVLLNPLVIFAVQYKKILHSAMCPSYPTKLDITLPIVTGALGRDEVTLETRYHGHPLSDFDFAAKREAPF